MAYTPPTGDNTNFDLKTYTPPSGDAINFEVIDSIIYTIPCDTGFVALTGYSILLKRIITGLLSYGTYALNGQALLFKKIKNSYCRFRKFRIDRANTYF